MRPRGPGARGAGANRPRSTPLGIRWMRSAGAIVATCARSASVVTITAAARRSPTRSRARLASREGPGRESAAYQKPYVVTNGVPQRARVGAEVAVDEPRGLAGPAELGDAAAERGQESQLHQRPCTSA